MPPLHISNVELGVCECPPGRSGPSCEELYWGACRTSEKAIHMFYAIGHLKSCACIKQIVKVALPNDNSANFYLSAVGRGGERSYRLCFERKGVAEDQQFSDIPSLTDSNVIWRTLSHHITQVGTEQPQGNCSEACRGGQVPLDKCPQRCSERGSCVDGTCKCMIGFEGKSCEAHVSNRNHRREFGCVNNCGFRGNCENGFCHCEPGYWGIDCTRSKAYEAEPGKAMEEGGKAYSRTQIKIYRYELPFTVAPYQYRDDWYPKDPSLYNAFLQFFTLFSNDTVVRVENPHEANFFYLPLFVFLNDDNGGDVYSFTKRALAYVNLTYPHLWGRNQGKDHFFWLPGDLGACWLRDEPLVQNPIKVVHWGLEVNAAQYVKMPHYHWVVREKVNKEYHCFKAERDIVAPCWMGSPVYALTGDKEIDSKGNDEAAMAEQVFKDALGAHGNTTMLKRPYLLFFGGSIRKKQFEYSGGARQAFHKYVLSGEDKAPSDVKFGGGKVSYREATFCLAPYGDGWGNRIVHIMQAACIPVIVQDHVYLPFEDLLDYSLFSLRMRVEDMPHLLEVLRRVTPDQIQRYREEMFKVYKAFSWVQTFDGQAYDYVIKSLRRRLTNLQGMHYSH
jgi:hypothetical protein